MNGHDYPRYERYKESGGEWLGDVPAHWDVVKIKTFTQRVRRQGRSEEMLLSVYRDHGVVPFGQIEGNHNRPSDDLSSYQLVEPGDLVLNKMKTWQGSLAVSGHRGIVSPAYIVCKIQGRIHGRFLHHLVRSPVYIAHMGALSYGVRVDQWDLRFEDFREIEALLPPFKEQAAIATFLDRETARIDALIEKQERLIEKLEEKRKALISRAVTQGLNPNVKMKDSGVDWLGRIPEHWKMLPLRRFLHRIEQGWSPLTDSREPESAEWGILKLSAVKRGKFIATEAKALQVGMAPLRQFQLCDGDFLLTRGNTPDLVADVCVVTAIGARQLLLSDLTYRLSLSSEYAPQFLCYWMLTQCARIQIQRDARGSSLSMVKVSQSHIRQWLVPSLPLTEQQQILANLDKAGKSIDRIVEKARNLIDKLRERRTALISAAVTGKIDVREVANG